MDADLDAHLGADPTGPTLDEEGIPDLQGPDPAKAATGDPQEGEPPPSTRPASEDWGVTGAEERHGEPLSVRTARERPDFGAPGALQDTPESLVLVDPADEDVDVEADVEKDVVGRVVPQSGLLVAPEDAAMHVVDDAEDFERDLDEDFDGEIAGIGEEIDGGPYAAPS